MYCINTFIDQFIPPLFIIPVVITSVESSIAPIHRNIPYSSSAKPCYHNIICLWYNFTMKDPHLILHKISKPPANGFLVRESKVDLYIYCYDPTLGTQQCIKLQISGVRSRNKSVNKMKIIKYLPFTKTSSTCGVDSNRTYYN
jgi:hypothetical protein